MAVLTSPPSSLQTAERSTWTPVGKKLPQPRCTRLFGNRLKLIEMIGKKCGKLISLVIPEHEDWAICGEPSKGVEVGVEILVDDDNCNCGIPVNMLYHKALFFPKSLEVVAGLEQPEANLGYICWCQIVAIFVTRSRPGCLSERVVEDQHNAQVRILDLCHKQGSLRIGDLHQGEADGPHFSLGAINDGSPVD